MKSILSLLLLLSLPCMAAEETAHNLVKNDAKVSGVQIVWALDVDFELTHDEVVQASAVPKGHTGMLAAKLFKLIEERALLDGTERASLPGVFSCSAAKVVLVGNKAWVNDSCKPIEI